MNEDMDINHTAEDTQGEENKENGEDESRPPVDPYNKLYTVISLLIFAVVYFGGGYLKNNLTLSYALYDDSFSETDRAAILERTGFDAMPENAALKYVRLHRNFDANSFYAAFYLPAELTDREDFPESFIPYSFGDPIEDRYTVYPENNAEPDYVYGLGYVSNSDPNEICIIYEDMGGTTALFRISGCRDSEKSFMDGSVKIPVKQQRRRGYD